VERFTRQSAPDSASSTPTASSAASPRPSAKLFDGAPTLGSKLLVLSLIVASIAVTAAFAVNVFKSFSSSSLVKDSQFQAVFLDNGQVYFGHLSDVNDEYIRLTNIYYLQVEQQIQPDQETKGEEAAPQQQISLAKLGNELHGPEDEMFVQRSKVVFWENLKTDGQVTQAIESFVSGDGGDN